MQDNAYSRESQIPMDAASHGYDESLDIQALQIANTINEWIKAFKYDQYTPEGCGESWRDMALGIGHACLMEIAVLQARRFYYQRDVRSAAAYLEFAEKRYGHIPLPLGQQVAAMLKRSNVKPYTFDEVTDRKTDPGIAKLPTLLQKGDKLGVNPFQLKDKTSGSRPRRNSLDMSRDVASASTNNIISPVTSHRYI
jgi:hypothetical protein